MSEEPKQNEETDSVNSSWFDLPSLSDLSNEEFQEFKRHTDCLEKVAGVMKDGNIQFLLYSLYKKGCTKNINIECKPCDREDIGAYFSMENGKGNVTICENNTLRGLKSNITHELVHAYDYCRADLDNTTCKELACTEIRAAMLSGECTMAKELLRGEVGFIGHMKKCVKRRATLSVGMHPHCQGVIAQKAVVDVFDACFEDREPFGVIPSPDKAHRFVS